MTSDGLTILIPVALLVIFCIVALIMSRKSWKFFHIFCCFLVLVGYVFFAGLSAMTLKTRLAWSQIYNQQTKDVEQAQKLNSVLKIGDQHKEKKTDWDKISQEEISLADAESQFMRVTFGLGRVWRNCAVTKPFDGSQVDLRLRADPAAAGAPHNALCPCNQCKNQSLQRSNKMYVFREESGLPNRYLGQFRVGSDTPDSVTLVATMVVNSLNYDLVELQTPSGPWALYEEMPVDGHGLFTDRAMAEGEFRADQLGLSDGEAGKRHGRMLASFKQYYQTMSAEDQLAFLKRLAKEDGLDDTALNTVDQALQAIYGRDRLGLDATRTTAHYQRLIDSFVYDGASMKDIPAGSPLVDENSALKATPEETWARVKFLQEVKDPSHIDVKNNLAKPSPFKVDALTRSAGAEAWRDLPDEEKQAEVEQQKNERLREIFSQRSLVFDIDGAAAAPALMQSNATGHGTYSEIPKDTIALFDLETATELKDDGLVEIVEQVFVRKLHEFPYLYRVVDAEGRRLAQKAVETGREFAMTYKSLKAVEAQTAEQEVEIAKLTQDRDHFRAEVKVIQDFQTKLEKDISQVQRDLARTYNETKFYEALLTELDRRVRDDINRQVSADGVGD